ncbi:GNAT family N-acetyltransferase [Kineococcus rhizosphaerae]|uniref:Acetyltransferase (GNAT) family protein n=1 Tax=Kineococcus rhizosphaerae TaxID=559628 RepID=A0A2T0RAQ0_9ACTN|nr:GNAT family N-acetyltransferase [Kineococcus rhizosphaerae]PRY18229.1 acetyltransferase (GNAT) family protein [Kineococcus rhizosphaerae]
MTTSTTALVEVLEDLDAVLAALSRRADVLDARCSPTASAAWVRSALEVVPPAAVWGVDLGGDEGFVALVDHVDDGGRRTGLLTGGGGYAAGLPSTSPAAAAALGAAVADAAARRGAALDLQELPDDPHVRAFAAGAGADVVPGLAVPVVERPGEGQQLVSAGVRKNLRKTANRLAADGVRAEVTISEDPARFAAVLPELETAYRDRDAVHGIACALDTPQGRRTWWSRLQALGNLGRRELAELRLDGELAAYVVGVPGAQRYGIFEGRFVTRWARYSPGRVLEHAVLQHAFTDPDVQVVDWMTGVAPETLLTVSRFEPRTAVRRAAQRASAR